MYVRMNVISPVTVRRFVRVSKRGPQWSNSVNRVVIVAFETERVSATAI